MDIVTGLSAASQALGLVKELKELDKSVGEAEFKLKIAELLEALADTRIALSQARTDLAEKNEEIRQLQQVLETLKSGDACPVCDEGHLKTIRVVPHPTFGEVGVQEKHLECTNQNCKHQEKRMHDPVGLLDK